LISLYKDQTVLSGKWSWGGEQLRCWKLSG